MCWLADRLHCACTVFFNYAAGLHRLHDQCLQKCDRVGKCRPMHINVDNLADLHKKTVLGVYNGTFKFGEYCCGSHYLITTGCRQQTHCLLRRVPELMHRPIHDQAECVTGAI